MDHRPSARTLGGFTEGSVLFMGPNFQIDEANVNLFWDNTNKRLGIGRNSGLLHELEIVGHQLIEQAIMRWNLPSTLRVLQIPQP